MLHYAGIRHAPKILCQIAALPGGVEESIHDVPELAHGTIDCQAIVFGPIGGICILQFFTRLVEGLAQALQAPDLSL
jgi:hypothetical protein